MTKGTANLKDANVLEIVRCAMADPGFSAEIEYGMRETYSEGDYMKFEPSGKNTITIKFDSNRAKKSNQCHKAS